MLKRNRLIYLIIFIFLISFVLAEEINKEGYKISKDHISQNLFEGAFLNEVIVFENLNSFPLNIKIFSSENLNNYLIFKENSLFLKPNAKTSFNFNLKGEKKGEVEGQIKISGDIVEKIPVKLKISEIVEEPYYFIETNLEKTQFNNHEDFQFSLLFNLINQKFMKEVNFTFYLFDSENNSIYLGSELKNISSSFKEIKTFKFPKEMLFGDYKLVTTATSGNEKVVSNSFFELTEYFLFIKLFGILPLWVIFSLLIFCFVIWLIFFLIKRKIKSGKKYSMELETNKLPKQNKEFLFLGKVAETRIKAYLEPERLKTHTIVAGATGGGKSISAQVIVEEALLQNTAVVVFDPTAQWSGMLRKCEDKKMLNYYSDFHLKPEDARAFPGNIRMVSNARELIDLEKYAHPGQIQIFAMNKLEPKDIDLFVANVIRGIFKSDPKETPELKLLIVFDEVHRLLAKFGGTGEGFLQIERACREFRKWGIGVMLVSQVLSDFVGEIKANINTELQMRTIEEGDLERIKTKYGDQFLKSLVKSEVGVGMLQNAEFNKGKPYFVNFRPILHNTRRLSDEVLEQYNSYNETVDQIEFEIETLEKKKVDVFDLKMELKLVKDKIMTGNFPVVDIYLQGLKPRLEKQWEKLGEKPPKLEKKLADLAEIKKSVEEARKAREEAEKTMKGEIKDGEKDIKEKKD